jgi:hypothetical protein
MVSKVFQAAHKAKQEGAAEMDGRANAHFFCAGR